MGQAGLVEHEAALLPLLHPGELATRAALAQLGQHTCVAWGGLGSNTHTVLLIKLSLRKGENSH